MKTKKFNLKNGLSVILTDTEAFPTITTYVSIGAGSRYENQKNNGISHFFEHMAFKGTKKYPHALDISSKIEGMGGVFNASTGKDKTSFYVKAPNDKFTDVIDILSEMILHSRLDPQEIEKEKKVIIEEIRMYQDEPSHMVGEIFEELIFKGHSMGQPIAGSEKSVQSLSQKTISDYLSALYHPENAVVSIAGGLRKMQSVNGKVQNYPDIIGQKFGKWDGRIKNNENQFIKKNSGPSLKVKTKKVEQTHLVLGFYGCNLHDKRRYSQAVLASILGGGMSSRLFIELREKRGLCYYVGTGSDLYKDTGYIYSQAGITNNKIEINEAIKVMLDQHMQVAEGKVTDEEFNRSKAHIRGQFLLALEDSRFIAGLSASHQLFFGKTIDVEDILKKMDAVRLEDVIALAREFFVPSNLNAALITSVSGDDVELKL